ncbi:MAG: ABC transporter ATP-binding protein [Bacillota bacterium]
MERNSNEARRSATGTFLTLIKIVLADAPVLFSIIFLSVGIVHGLSFAVTTPLMQRLFDSVEQAVISGSGVSGVVLAAFMMVLTIILCQVLNGFHNFLGNAYRLLLSGSMRGRINCKAARLSPILYENPDTLNLINQANEGANYAIDIFDASLSLTVFYLPYFVFMFIYLYLLEPVLAASLLLIFVPLALSQLVRHFAFAQLEDEIAPLRRENEYWRTCIGNKETRLLGAFGYFRSLFSQSLQLLNAATWRAEKQSGLAELAMQTLTLCGYISVIWLFVDALLKGRISVGAFAAVFASIDLMFAIMHEVVCGRIGGLARCFGPARNFMKFLDLQERGGICQTKDTSGIRLKNVSFSYPNAAIDSLQNVDLEIARGEIIAVVGENGAGKSTLVKLALGLYEPTAGVVEQAGLDTRVADMSSLFTGVSAVFQNFQRYKMTLQENVTVSSPQAADRAIEPLLGKTGLSADDNVFPSGNATMLSREFDGVELSGGQWQRVAIARGLYRAHDIIVLDEPTAAIDPVEEANLYRQFAAIAAGKTAIIVTHRLGSAKIADRIIVLDGGRVIETGTHDELIARNGKYAEMYSAQAKWYVKDNEKERATNGF